jgi:hypothetical protein
VGPQGSREFESHLLRFSLRKNRAAEQKKLILFQSHPEGVFFGQREDNLDEINALLDQDGV